MISLPRCQRAVPQKQVEGDAIDYDTVIPLSQANHGTNSGSLPQRGKGTLRVKYSPTPASWTRFANLPYVIMFSFM